MASHAPASWQHWSATLKKSTPGAGTFKEAAKVHTSRTLYITNLPGNIMLKDLQGLFQQDTGFLSARRVRGMGFCDFDTKQDATNALDQHQGHKFKEGDRGILISYDKDDGDGKVAHGKRQQAEFQRQKEALDATYCRLVCKTCAKFCLKLTKSYSELPKRRTDNSVVVLENLVVALDMAKGDALAIKREKGVERQYRLHCVQCDMPLAYRSVPFGKQGKFLYLMQNAVSERGASTGTLSFHMTEPKELTEGEKWRAAAAADMKARAATIEAAAWEAKRSEEERKRADWLAKDEKKPAAAAEVPASDARKRAIDDSEEEDAKRAKTAPDPSHAGDAQAPAVASGRDVEALFDAFAGAIVTLAATRSAPRRVLHPAPPGVVGADFPWPAPVHIVTAYNPSGQQARQQRRGHLQCSTQPPWGY